MTLDISAIRQRIEEKRAALEMLRRDLLNPTPRSATEVISLENEIRLRERWLSDLLVLCDEVEALRAQLTRVYRCESCKFDYHATILERDTIPCPTCKAPATRISVPTDESPKKEGK